MLVEHEKPEFVNHEPPNSSSVLPTSQVVYQLINHRKLWPIAFIAFVKERFHNAVEIDILGIFEGYSSLQIWPPPKIFQGRNYSGRMT